MTKPLKSDTLVALKAPYLAYVRREVSHGFDMFKAYVVRDDGKTVYTVNHTARWSFEDASAWARRLVDKEF
jgi:hypothetical protein